MASGVPKKSRTRGPAGGTLSDGPLGCAKAPARSQVRRTRRARIPGPVNGVGRGGSAEPFALGVSPMSEVSRVLPALERGDPHAAGQLLPLVYDELRKLAAARLAREAPGNTLDATA